MNDVIQSLATPGPTAPKGLQAFIPVGAVPGAQIKAVPLKSYVVPPGVVTGVMRHINAVVEYARDGNLYFDDLTVSRFTRPGHAS